VKSEECPSKLERSESEVGPSRSMYYVYLLELGNGRFYAGSTLNLEKRFKEHVNGYCVSTKDHRPVKIVFYAAFRKKEIALSFERYLKTASGKAFRNKRLI